MSESSKIPSANVLRHAAKIAIEQDRPVLLDYFVESIEGTAFLGQNAKTSDKLLIKSAEEYTSPIKKIFKVDECFIILTENSLYIVHADIKKRRVE